MTTHSGDVLTEADLEKMLNDSYDGALPQSQTPVVKDEPVTPAVEVTTDADTTNNVTAADSAPVTSVEAPNDPLAALPEDARAAVLERFAQLEKQNAELSRNYHAQLGRNRALEQKKQTAPVAPVKLAAPADEEDPFADVRKVDPELAAYLDKSIQLATSKAQQKFEQELAALRERDIAPLHQNRVETERQREEAILDQTVPNWREAEKDPHFLAYAASLPPFMQEALDKASTANDLLWFFDDYNRRFFPNAAPGGDPVKAPTPPATQPSVTAQRQQRLAASVTPAGSTPAPKPDVVDEAKLLEEAYKSGSSAGFYHKR